MSPILQHADWTFPVPIRYGPGRIRELGAMCREAGVRRPLIVTDRGSRDLPFISAAVASLEDAGLQAALFSDVAPNPTGENVLAGRQRFCSGGHDGVIAIGGGSGMDAGKAISLVAWNDRALAEFDFDSPAGEPEPGDGFPPLFCVPTTAGTGAETESTAMVTDTGRSIKICVWHAKQKPRAALLDPELTLGLPPHLTAWTGCDALVHAVEALSVPQWNPLCDGLALEALRLVYRWLPNAYRDGSDLEARGAMLVGSCLAGISFLKGLGLVHAVSHMVGAVHDTQHGLTNAILLPAVLRYNRDELGEKTALMCRAMALPGESFDHFYEAVVRLLDELEIPRGLDALGVSERTAPEIARKAYGDAARATNPVPAAIGDIEALIREAIVGAR